MIVGIGSELRSVEDVRSTLLERDDLFTPNEIAYCEAKRYPAVHYAARLAAKSALLGALGLPDAAKLEIETRNAPDGKPMLDLSGLVLQAARRANVGKVHLSMTHTRAHAAAFVVLES